MTFVRQGRVLASCRPCQLLNHLLVFTTHGGVSLLRQVSTGTIFAVYERVSTSPIGCVEDILRTGNDIVAAGYCMYGAATELVMCFKQGKVRRAAFLWPPLPRVDHSLLFSLSLSLSLSLSVSFSLVASRRVASPAAFACAMTSRPMYTPANDTRPTLSVGMCVPGGALRA